MTKFTIPIKNILGLSYYRYEVSTSNVNITYGAEITVTAKVTNIFGNPVSNKTVTLYENGTSKGEQTTDSNGEAEWTYNVTNCGVRNLTVGNAHTNIKVGQWVEETSVHTSVSYAHLYINHCEKMCFFRYYRTNYNFSNTSDVTLHTNMIPSNYRNSDGVTCAVYNPNIGAYINENGTMSAVSISTGQKTINATAMWKY